MFEMENGIVSVQFNTPLEAQVAERTFIHAQINEAKLNTSKTARSGSNRIPDKQITKFENRLEIESG